MSVTGKDVRMPSRPIVKTFTLKADQEQRLRELAQKQPFFAAMLDRYHKYGTLTEKQYAAFLKHWEEVWLGGVKVKNRFLRDGSVLCFLCPEFATQAIGDVGLCDAHADMQHQRNAERHAPGPEST